MSVFATLQRATLLVWLLCGMAACRPSPNANRADHPLVEGTWKLVSSESRSEDGHVEATFGPNPVGLLVYSPDGRMSVHLMRRDRSNFQSDDSSHGTPDELKAAFDSYLSYFGTYEIDTANGVVSHRIEGCSFPNWTGTLQRRHFVLDGNRLSLITPPIRTNDKDVRVHLIWARADRK